MAHEERPPYAEIMDGPRLEPSTHEGAEGESGPDEKRPGCKFLREFSGWQQWCDTSTGVNFFWKRGAPFDQTSWEPPGDWWPWLPHKDIMSIPSSENSTRDDAGHVKPPSNRLSSKEASYWNL